MEEEEENICDNCNKYFSTKSSLKLHLKTNTCKKNKEKKIFKCDFCDKILSSNQMMLYHLNSCSERKVFLKEREFEEIIKNLN